MCCVYARKRQSNLSTPSRDAHSTWCLACLSYRHIIMFSKTFLHSRREYLAELNNNEIFHNLIENEFVA